MDLDVPIQNGVIQEEYRLMAGLPTLELCLQNAASVVVCGHIGRPLGKEVKELSVAPIVNFFEDWYCDLELPQGRFHVLENLRFEAGEDSGDLNFAKELAAYGDVYVYEAFATHRSAASTTIVPTLIPSAAGLRFAKEVEVLLSLKNNPKKPLVAIIGGAKVEDKYPAVVALSKFCDAVMVGGLLAKQVKEQDLQISKNVLLGKIAENGIDIDQSTIEAFAGVIKHAKQVIWAGPVGKYEDPQGNKGNIGLAQAVIDSGAESIIGGGDSIAALEQFLDKFSFVSTGGGAMLKLLIDGTLPTIEALNR
ncbi:phosphoglycerate kinase [Candidatus Daviesbacteria bacterium]|nr:phosphoglycerate kinase [Candidatus Daviesbacteria bacterium]